MQLPEFLLIRRNQYIIGGISFVLIVGIIFALTQQKPTAAPVVNEQVTLNWWKPFYGNEIYSDIINDFKKLPGNQNININIVTKEYNGD
jgi:ABC-type glycerol-3-phosphate transport system substrate-binding protein